MDAPVLPRLSYEQGATAIVCSGLQPGKLPTPFGSAPIYQPLVIAHLADKVDRDRSEGRQTCPLHLLPDGGSVDRTKFVFGNLPRNSTVDATGAGVTIQAYE